MILRFNNSVPSFIKKNDFLRFYNNIYLFNKITIEK